MFRHHFKIAWRNLLRERQFSLLNLMGLGIGLACTILIYLWVHNEMKVDAFHAHDSRLYQVMERQQVNDVVSVSFRTSGLTATELKEKMPEVEYAVPVMHHSWFPQFMLSATANNKIKGVGQFAGEDFFNVFSYQLIEGNKDRVLHDKRAIVISESLSRKLFNSTQNVTGKVLSWELAGFKKDVIVSGVFKDIPANSSEQFDFVLSFEDFKEISPSVLSWGNDGTNAYMVLQKGTDVEEFNKKIAGFIATKRPGKNRSLFLAPFSDNYLYNKYENGVQSGGRIEYVRLFSIVAAFILIIACINFMNLSTARASRRLKEVGIKKVVGADRKTLVLQYMSESLLMAFLSLVVALALVIILLPQFNLITGKSISPALDPMLILAIIGITLVTGLLSGSYPALYLSGFNPIGILKGKFKTSVAELYVRKGLVVFQFSLSVIFIIAVLVVYKQVQLIQTKNLGYDKQNIIYFSKEGKIQEAPDAFIAELKNIRGVVNASTTDHRFAGSYNITGGLEWPGRDPMQDMHIEIVHANYDMIETLGIEMKEGRAFSRDFGADSTKIIFNEAAINQMGLKDPVGKMVKLWGHDMEIAGVAKNFHFQSLHENVKPLFIILEPKNTHYVVVKLGKGLESQVLPQVKALYAKYNPGASFEYKFMDDDFQALYVSEQRVASLSRYFAGLAIIISCLGLFGLAAFTAQRRQKEIGIRKVLGASAGNVAFILSKDFVKLVMIAVLIAFPLAWWAMSEWLHGFAYRVSLRADIFLIAGASMLLVTLITVSFQAIRTAVSNPVKSLRSE